MPALSSNLRLNMTGAESEPALRALRYRTAIDMASYADARGFSSVNVTPKSFSRPHPIFGVGGMPLDKAWQCLHLYSEQGLAPLLAEQAK